MLGQEHEEFPLIAPDLDSYQQSLTVPFYIPLPCPLATWAKFSY